MNFIPDAEKKLSKDFEKNGYIIKNIQDLNSLEKLRKIFLKIIKKNVRKTSKQSSDKILNEIVSMIIII